MQLWILPCNLKYYDIKKAFSMFSSIDWHQTNLNVCVGDIVYIYVSSPAQQVRYKCRVTCVKNRNPSEKDACCYIDTTAYENYKNYMTLELIYVYNDIVPTYKGLLENGMNCAPRGINKVSDRVQTYLDSCIV